MATVRIPLPITAFFLPASAYAQWDVFTGTNFPIPVLAFDAATDETCFVLFRADNYGSGSLTVAIDWYADTGSSGNVVWQVRLAAITPDTDTQDVETKAFATLNFVQDTHLGTTNQRLHRAIITLSNLDSLAAGDWCVLELTRDANGTNATDDMSGDALVSFVEISYSDT